MRMSVAGRRWWLGGPHGLPREVVIEEIWRRHFERRAEWAIGDAQRSGWSADGRAARVAAFESLLPELAPSSPAAVLDLGCGAARCPNPVADLGHQVSAVGFWFCKAQRA